MSTPAPPAADPVADLDAAHRAHVAATTSRASGTRISSLEFSGQLNFLVTIGYLTKDQGAALFEWFTTNGMTPLPALPDPAGVPNPSMYETLSTSIHFGTHADAADPGTHSIFDDILGAVTDLISTTLGGVTDVLSAGTALVQAGSVLVGQLHDLAAF